MLFGLQKDFSTTIETFLQVRYQLDAEDAVLPQYQFKWFASKDELFDYTSEKDYTYQDGRPGVCFGFGFT